MPRWWRRRRGGALVLIGVALMRRGPRRGVASPSLERHCIDLGERPWSGAMGLTGFVACVCAGGFFGAAAYISLVQHPAALAAGSDVAVRLFPPMYQRAAPMQATLAVLGSLAGLLRWLVAGGAGWVVGAFFLGSVVPLTLAAIKPINDELLSPALAPDDPDIVELLARWGQLHWLRTVASGVAFLLFLA